MAFRTLVSKPWFSQSLSLNSHLSLPQVDLPEFSHLFVLADTGGITLASAASVVHYNIVIFTYLLTYLLTELAVFLSATRPHLSHDMRKEESSLNFGKQSAI